MGELKHRKRISTTVSLELLEKMKELQKKTRLHFSTLFEEALNDLLDKYEDK